MRAWRARRQFDLGFRRQMLTLDGVASGDSIGIWQAPGVFRALALRHFSFLVDEFGFRVADESATPFVVFASDNEEVWVYYNAEWHHELDVAFRDPADPDGASRGIDMLLADGGLGAVPADDLALQMPSSEGQLDTALLLRASQVRQLITRRNSERRQ